MALGPFSDRICFTSPVVLTCQHQNHLGTVGLERRDYQRVMKMFIIDCGDGFMVCAYVKTYQIAYLKRCYLLCVNYISTKVLKKKKESPGRHEIFHFQ